MKSHDPIEPRLLERILERIVRHLADAAGIDPASLEAGRIRWTIERRCRHLGLTGASAYLNHMESSPAELECLIDALVIQETRFFRDPAVFEHLRIWARDLGACYSGPLRILSAPCSTGQEAYSLAATLLCAGIPSTDFNIDAFDISHTALAVAQRGVYPAGTLEHVPEDLRAACGTLQNQHWHMRDELRTCLRFDRRNLADSAALGDEPRYHLILCRNLFIYLHAKTRAILAESLSRVLLPGGRLIVGAGDRVPELNALFTPLNPAASFGFTHKPVVTSRASAAPLQPVKAGVPRFILSIPKPEEQPAPATAVEFYRRAVEYKERGNVRQAERRCRQALYLAPGYLPALELLQALWHMHPNARLRRALKARIQRVRVESEMFLGTQHQAEGEPV
jgi:chemotaxis protein methyltransferase WspC